ncbi:MAG: right-handed parallel beta-helix repeat-containing protein [Candidatus Bathyarchaeota archaeon]
MKVNVAEAAEVVDGWLVYYEGDDESAYRFNVGKHVSGLEIWLYISTDDSYAKENWLVFNDDWIGFTLVSSPVLVATSEGQYVVEPIVGLAKIGYKEDGEKSVGGVHGVYYALPKDSFVSYVNITLHAIHSKPRLDTSRSYMREWNPFMDIVGPMEVGSKGWYTYTVSDDCKGSMCLVSFGTPVGDQPMSSSLTWCFGKRIHPPSLAYKPDVYVEVGYAGGVNIAPELFAGQGNYRCKINVGVGAGQTLNEAIASHIQETVYMVEKGGPPLVADEAASGSADILMEVVQEVVESPIAKKALEALGYVKFILDLVDIILTLGFDETVAESKILVFKDVSVGESFIVYFNSYAEIASAGLSGAIVNFWGECPFGSSVFDNLGFSVVNLPDGGMWIGGILLDYHDPYPVENVITIRSDGCVSPPTLLIVSRDFRVYSLTGDAETTILVERDNIVLDGHGHRVNGGVAVVQTGGTCRKNVTVTSMRVEGGLDGLTLYHIAGIWTLTLNSYDKHGIFLNDVVNVTIFNNTIVGCQVGVAAVGARSCVMLRNNITNTGLGIGVYLRNGHYCVSTEQNVISENIILACEVGIFDDGCWGPNNITRNLLVGNGEGVRAEGVMETISHNNIVQCAHGIISTGQTGEKVILGNTILNCSSGIDMRGFSVQISRNRVADCSEFGILLEGCSVSENEVLSCTRGIIGGGNIIGNSILNCVYGVSYCYGNITGNNIVNASIGIYLTGEEFFAEQIHSVVQQNNITRCCNGVFVEGLSNGVEIRGNNFIENDVGVYMTAGWNKNHVVVENNFVMNNFSVFVETDYLPDVIVYIFHNNFVGNKQACGDPPRCVWDNGYPSGGNYWSDYVGVDEKSGVEQNQPGADGIGDKPYKVGGDAVDRYPLMEPTSNLPLMTINHTIQERTILLTSNSVILNLKYDLKNQTLSFYVQGKTGTKGFVNLTVPKSIVSGQTSVLFDGKPIHFNVSEGVGYVNITFTYDHSKHYVEICFSTGEGPTLKPSEEGVQNYTVFVIIAITLFLTVLLSALYLKRRKIT